MRNVRGESDRLRREKKCTNGKDTTNLGEERVLLMFPEPSDVISQALSQGDGTGKAKRAQPGNISDQLLRIARPTEAAELNLLPC